MAPMTDDEAAAERLEAVYLTADVAAQRAATLRLLAPRRGERILDIGSGPGFLAADLAEAVGPDGEVRGVDLSEPMVARAAARSRWPWLGYRTGDAALLPEPDGRYDATVSVQVAEYVPDVEAFCAELHRVLRPGGRAVVMATDWDAVVWFSDRPERMARVLDAFRGHCADPNLPRRLLPLLSAAGFEGIGVRVHAWVTTDWAEPTYCEGLVDLLRADVEGRGLVPAAELEGWASEQRRLAAEGRLFFSSARFLFSARKPG